MLFAGEIIENNGLMTKSLQKRLARYKDRDDLREYLLRKTRKMSNLSESSTKMIGESSDDGMISLRLISENNSVSQNFFFW